MKNAVGNPPTLTQQAVLDLIRSSYRTTGYPPSMREIATEFGWSSQTGAAVHIRLLVAKGLLRPLVRGKSCRYLPVVPDGCCLLRAEEDIMNTPPDLPALVRLVSRMRAAQKRYFRERSSWDLTTARRLEAEVDLAIAACIAAQDRAGLPFGDDAKD